MNETFPIPASGSPPAGRESCRAPAPGWGLILLIALLAAGCEISAGFEERESNGTNGTEKTDYRFKWEAGL